MVRERQNKSLLICGPILVFGVFVIGCAGLEKVPWTRGDKVALGAMIVCTAADVATTIYGLNNGFREINPIYGDDPSPGILIISNAIITGGIYWAVQYLSSEQRKILYVPAGMHCSAAALNYKKIQEN